MDAAQERRTRRGRTRAGAAALVVIAGVLGWAVAVAPGAAADNTDNVNNPAYWEAQGWGNCVKYSPVSTPYQLAAAPSGSHWSLLVLKAGSEASNSDWLTQIENPAPGTYYHPSGKSISHVILCSQSGPPVATTTTSTPGGGCGTYMPTNVAVTPTHGQPGDTLTVTGSGAPGATITVSISNSSHPPLTVGTTVVGPTGSFSAPFILPDTYAAGNYTLSVLSTGCPTPKTLTIVIDPLDLSGCGPNSDRTYSPGEVVSWTLMGPPFDTSKPVTVRLSPRGPGGSGTMTLYTGAFPASGDVTITIPTSIVEAKYFIEQVGTQKNKKTMTKSCPVRVGLPYVLAGAAGNGGPSSPSSIAGSAGKAMIIVAAGLLLLALRVHAPRRRRRTS